jgi:hypothetical protein
MDLEEGWGNIASIQFMVMIPVTSWKDEESHEQPDTMTNISFRINVFMNFEHRPEL